MRAGAVGAKSFHMVEDESPLIDMYTGRHRHHRHHRSYRLHRAAEPPEPPTPPSAMNARGRPWHLAPAGLRSASRRSLLVGAGPALIMPRASVWPRIRKCSTAERGLAAWRRARGSSPRRGRGPRRRSGGGRCRAAGRSRRTGGRRSRWGRGRRSRAGRRRRSRRGRQLGGVAGEVREAPVPEAGRDRRVGVEHGHRDALGALRQRPPGQLRGQVPRSGDLERHAAVFGGQPLAAGNSAEVTVIDGTCSEVSYKGTHTTPIRPRRRILIVRNRLLNAQPYRKGLEAP